jgi:hemolysin III
MPEREVKKLAAEYLRPINQGLESIGSATNFTHYVENTYKPVMMPLMAKTTQDRSKGIIANYLTPAFGKPCLRDLTSLTLQRYFSGLSASTLAHDSKDKIRDVLSGILGSAVQYGLLVKNPVEVVRMPVEKRGKRKTKPHVTPEQFEQLVNEVPEPYASMVYVAVWTGLRISESIGLRWVWADVLLDLLPAARCGGRRSPLRVPAEGSSVGGKLDSVASAGNLTVIRGACAQQRSKITQLIHSPPHHVPIIGPMDELANALTHGIGLLLALVAVPVLIVLAATQATVWHVVGVSVYGASLIALYTASTIYHSVQHPPAKRILRIIDHSAIYLFIAGTYTPFTLVNLRGTWGWTLLGLVWTIALFGVAWKLVQVERHPVVSTIVYIAMGWLVVIAARPLFRAIPLGGLAWLLAGGLAYTLGVAFFASSRFRFNHALWHLFVLAGSACHYVAVMRYVLPHRGV